MKKLYFGIFLIPLIVNPFGFEIYSSAKIAWFLLFVGLIVGYAAFSDAVKLKCNKKVLIYLILWFLSLVLSTVFSVTPVQSLFGDYSYATGLFFYFLLAVHFFVCFALFSEKKARELFFTLVKWMAAIMSVYAIAQYFNPENAQYLFRSYSTIGQPNFLAQFLIFPLFVVLFSVKNLWNKKAYRKMGIDIFVLILIALAIYLTKSRAVILALFASFYLWFMFFAGVKRWYKVALTALLFLIVAAIPLFGFFDMRSVNSRIFLWSSVFPLIDLKNVWIGSGLNSFYREFVTVMPKEVFQFEQFYTNPVSPHNELIQALLERGGVGAILYVIPPVYLFYLLFKRRVQTEVAKVTVFALLAYIVSVQLSFSVVEHFVFLAAFWAILLLEVVNCKSIVVSTKNFLKKGVLVVFSIFLLFSSFSIVEADVLLANGMGNYVVDLQESYLLFDKGARAVPVFAYPRQIIVNLFVKDFPEKVDEHLDMHGFITNDDFKYNILAMEAAAAGGNMDLVDEYFKKAAEIAPNLPAVYTKAGDIYFEAGDCERAVANYETLKGLAPVYVDGSEEKRLFEKHAFGFVRAMGRMEECKAGRGAL